MSSKRLSVIGYPSLVVYINTIHKHYYWRETVNGVRYERATKIHAGFEIETINGKLMARPTRNIQIALQVAEKFKHEIIKEGYIKKEILFSTLLDDVLAIQKNKSKRTYIIAGQSEKHLRPFLGKISLRKFDDEFSTIWASYVEHEKEISSRKLLHDCKFLIFALRVAYQKKWISRIYSRKDFPIPDKSDRVGKFVSEKDVKRIVDEIELIGDKKFLCQIVVALDMGLRKSEILGLRLDEIDKNKKEINLDPVRIKTRKARQIPIPITERAWKHLKPFYNKAQEMKGYHVFPYELNNGHGVLCEKTDANFDWDRCQIEFPRYWDELRKNLNLDIRFHDFRHTCVSNMIINGIPLAIISQFLGADMKILNEVYAHHNDKSKELFRNALIGIYNF